MCYTADRERDAEREQEQDRERDPAAVRRKLRRAIKDHERVEQIDALDEDTEDGDGGGGGLLRIKLDDGTDDDTKRTPSLDQLQ